MKRIIYCFLLISIYSSLEAQEKSWDLNLGYRYQKTKFEDGSWSSIQDVKGMSTSRGALFANFYFNIYKNLNFNTGIQISNNGQLYKYNQNDLYRYYKQTYIKIPALICFSKPKNNTKIIYPKVSIGPQVSILGNNSILESSSADFINSTEINSPTAMKSAVLDIVAKFGMDIKLKNSTYLFLGLNLDGSITKPMEGSVQWIEIYSHYSTLGVEIGLNWTISKEK